MASLALDHFRTAVRMADAADLADTVLLMFGDPVAGSAELAAELAAESRASVCAAYYGGGAVEQVERRKMQRAGVAVFPSPERAMKAIGASCWYAEQRRLWEAER
jgi:acyl-CoA synthetase (NDP forming)